MFYFERSYKVLNRIGQLSEKILYDTIQPFVETPPEEKELPGGQPVRQLPSDLFTTFTAGIMKKNVVFFR